MTDTSGMNFSRAIPAVVLAALFLAAPCLGSSDGPGSTGASYLTLPVSPRSIGMGETGAALESPFSLFYNPALLAKGGGRGIGVSHSEWIIDTRYDNLSAYASLPGSFAVGAGITYLYRPKIEGYDQFGPTGEKFRTDNYQLMVGVRFSPIPFLSMGLGFKHFKENLGEWHAEGVALDAGLVYSVEKLGTTAGLSVQNIGPDVKFRSLEEPIPLTVRMGASQSIRLIRLKTSVNLSADAVKPRYEDIYFNAGIEITTHRILCLRAGYSGREHRPGSGFSMGGGIRIREYMRLDYAFSPYGELGDFHRISMHFSR